MTLPTPPRLQWFLDRIGTKIYPSKTDEPNEGYFVASEMYAVYFYNKELEDPELVWFSTKEERDEHERNKT